MLSYALKEAASFLPIYSYGYRSSPRKIAVKPSCNIAAAVTDVALQNIVFAGTLFLFKTLFPFISRSLPNIIPMAPYLRLKKRECATGVARALSAFMLP